WKAERGTPYVPSPILYGDQLYFTQSNQGILTSLLASDGSDVFERTRVPDLGDIYASPVGADGRTYFVGRRGTTVVIEHGQELKVLATNQLADNFHASPALAGGQIFLRGMRFLYCLEEGAKATGFTINAGTTNGGTRALLETIAKRALPKDYPGKGHQIFVDNWFKTAGPKGGEVGRLWKEQVRLFPHMENKGHSFIRILDYVRTEGGPPTPAEPKHGNRHIKNKQKAEIRREAGTVTPGVTGAVAGSVRSHDGQAMGGVMVSAFDDRNRQSISVFTQLNGTFQIDGLHQANYRIRARLPGQRDHWIEDVALGDDKIAVTMEPARGRELEEQRPATSAFAQLKFDSPRRRDW
ncbi:MAG: carboxypeptidase regulatory-like domain-containing protein, partial [Verrucomicrobiota bacterium]